jgi:hypothetical protein
MMHPSTVQALAQARSADLRHQARRDALGRAARQARRARKQWPGHRASAMFAPKPQADTH